MQNIVAVRQHFWKSTHIRKIMSRNGAGRYVNGTFAGAAAQYSFWAGIPDIDVIAGTQGPPGPQGLMGSQGNPGPQGTQGSPGQQGATGSQGSPGQQGATGSQGNPGPQGTQGSPGQQGAIGSQGNPGPQGTQGSPGQQGAMGVQGNPGVQGSNYFSAFLASGPNPVTLATLVSGLPSSGAGYGLGTSFAIAAVASPMTLASGTTALVAPVTGTITAIYGTFTVTVAATITTGTGRINYQLYSAPSTSNNFTAIAASSFNLIPGLITNVSVGTMVMGSLTGLSIPVTAGDRYQLVVTIVVGGGSAINTVVGVGDCGIAFSS